jgi:uncharacterized phage protein (TIGR01671 family)
MREIKFRAWHPGFKFMDTVEILNVYGKNVDVKTNSWKYDDCVLMQSTGLRDKFGTDIYEGDVISARVHDGGIDKDVTEKVYWDDEYACFGPFMHIMDFAEDRWIDVASNIRIIGNIYENPELVSKKD